MSFERFGFKEVYVDETHPIIHAAHAERKHYEPCWCGSGKKFKKCHRLRSEQTPEHPRKLTQLSKDYFSSKSSCFVPDCFEDAINSHTIQKRGPLAAISEKSHVYFFAPESSYTGNINPEKISWNKASTFSGCCNKHDSDLFKDVEQKPFSGSMKQCLLIGYRSVSHELYKKQALIEFYKEMGMRIDKGRNLEGQIRAQLTIRNAIEQNSRSKDELTQLKEDFESCLFHTKRERFLYCYVLMAGKPSVISSGTVHTDVDISGNILYDIEDDDVFGEAISYGTILTEEGVYVAFAWPEKYTACTKYIHSLFEDESKLVEKMHQYFFWECENTFFSENWWNSLGMEQKNHIRTLALSASQNCMAPPLMDGIKFGLTLKQISKINKSG